MAAGKTNRARSAASSRVMEPWMGTLPSRVRAALWMASSAALHMISVTVVSTSTVITASPTNVAAARSGSSRRS
jgi:hypothetical protein